MSRPMDQENRWSTSHICVFIIYKCFIYLLANKAVELADLKHFAIDLSWFSNQESQDCCLFEEVF